MCEGCDNVYTCITYLTAKGSGSGGTKDRRRELATRGLRKALRKQHEKLRAGDFSPLLGGQPCPSCGYKQSWLVKGSRREKNRAVGWLMYLGIGILVAIGGAFRGFATVVGTILMIAALAVLMVGTGFILYPLPFHPNQKWLEERGKRRRELPAARQPLEVVNIPAQALKRRDSNP